MTTRTRTTRQTVTFARPFVLSDVEGAQPAGSYTVETDEELLQALSFPAHRRLETRIRLRGADGGAGFEQVVRIDPADLDDALAKDATGEPRTAAVAGESAPVLAPTSTVPTGQTRPGPAGPVAAVTTPTAEKSAGASARPPSRRWPARSLAELKLTAMLFGGLAVLGFLMSFDLPLAAGP